MRFFIKEYIDKITIQNIIDFGNQNEIYLTKKEANILLNYLKTEWETIIYGNPDKIVNEINKSFEKSKSKKIINLFNKYKTTYKNFLFYQ